MQNFIRYAWTLSPIFGVVMFLCTYQSFGLWTGIVLGSLSTMAFFVLAKREYRNIARESLTTTIKDAIAQVATVDSIVEFRSLRSGLLVRIYLINCKDKVNIIHQKIIDSIDESKFRNTLAIMQLTEMAKRDNLQTAREILNEQLLDELRRNLDDGK